MPENVAGWAGYIIAALTILGTWLTNRRKSDVDESALILGKWKELVDNHQRDIRDIKEEFTAYKKTAVEEFSAYKLTAEAEINSVRTRLSEAEKRITQQDQVISALTAENAGLKRAIAQNSQSAAVILGRSVHDREIEGMVDKLDQAGGNSRGRGDERE